MALIQLGRYEAAAEAGRRASQHANTRFWAYFNLASALGHLGQTEDAQNTFKKLLEMKPDFSFSTAIAEHAPLNPHHTNVYLERALEGLRKAGLDIPGEPAADD